MNKETLGAFIAQTRKETGLTQKSLADQLHVTDKAVSKWERGLCYPDLTLMEALAAALGLTMTELMTCQREKEEEISVQNHDMAVRSLLDISGETIQRQRKTIWKRAAVAAAVLILLLAAGIFYFSTVVTEIRDDVVLMKQSDGSDYYIYVENDNHLLRLRCPDEEIYDAVEADPSLVYKIRCRWNRLTYQGTVAACEAEEDVFAEGGPMEEVGSSFGVDSLLGRACVWQERVDIYPDPQREHGYLYTCRYYYFGDGSDYFSDGAETDLLTVKNYRETCQYDYDEDGIVELFVLTKYEEEPYMLYDLEDGQIIAQFVDQVPRDVLEWFQREL